MLPDTNIVPEVTVSEEYNLNLARDNHPMIIRSKIRISKPKLPFVGEIEITAVPKTVSEAIENPTWYKAMKLEFEALQQNHTWSLVPSTPNMHVVGSKWICKVKYKSDGSIDKHKAMLVAQGFTQTLGLDFFDTFSLVIKPAIVRIILSIAATLDWPVH